MESKTIVQLEKEAKALGIKLVGTETREELIGLIEKKPEQDALDEAEVIRIKEEGKIAEAKLKMSQQRAVDEKKYSEEDVKRMIKDIMKDMKANDVVDDDDDKPKQYLCTIPRFDNKFIVGFANLNKDPFFPDRVITSQNIFNDQTRQFIPNVTVIFHDDTAEKESRLTVPFETILKVSNKITCKIIERKQKDASVKFGQIHVQELKGDLYSPVLTGEVVHGKQVKKSETFLVETPDGLTLLVSPDVINWKPSPQIA